jgi:hypothetical protein
MWRGSCAGYCPGWRPVLEFCWDRALRLRVAFACGHSRTMSVLLPTVPQTRMLRMSSPASAQRRRSRHHSSIALRQPGPRNRKTRCWPETLISILYIAKVLRWPKGSTQPYPFLRRRRVTSDHSSGVFSLASVSGTCRSRALPRGRGFVSPLTKQAGPIRGRARDSRRCGLSDHRCNADLPHGRYWLAYCGQ